LEINKKIKKIKNNDLFMDIKNSNVLSNDLYLIYHWCKDNNLVIKTDKTKSMLVAG
jgi:hypothetical protein